MERMEMQELLCRKTGVSAAEAQAVLEENHWDILDAVVALDRKSRVPAAVPEDAWREERPAASVPETKEKTAAGSEPLLTNGFAVLWRYAKRLGKLSLETSFTVLRREQAVLTVPVLVLVLLLVGCFWVTLPLLLVGLFFGFQYRFEGRRTSAANKAMDKLGGVVESFRHTLDD